MSNQKSQRELAVENFVARIEETVMGDILLLSRQRGIVPTPDMREQAETIAALAAQALMRNVRFVSVKTGERTADVEQYRFECEMKGEGNFEADKLAPQQAKGLADAIQAHSLALVVPSVEGDLSIWEAILMVIPVGLHEAAAPPKPIKPPSSIIIPGR